MGERLCLSEEKGRFGLYRVSTFGTKSVLPFYSFSVNTSGNIKDKVVFLN